MTDKEPLARTSRRSGEMPIRPGPASPHAGHDLELLAAALDRDATSALVTAAATQAAACPECAALATDLRRLASAIAGLPALPAQPAPRDMRITPELAARLRRGGFLRRLLQPFGTEGSPVVRQLASALTTLGLAGILLSSLPLGLGFLGLGASGAAAPVLNTVGSAIDQESSAAPAALPAASAAGGQGGSDFKGFTASPAVPAQGPAAQPTGSATPRSAGGGFADGSTGSQAIAPPGTGPELPALAWISLALVAVGLALFGIRFVARRLA